jgi:hypothetical protein
VKRLVLPLAAAAYGLGCAIALAVLTIGPPHPGQLPGPLLLRGFDARTPMRMMLLAMAGPFASALLLTPLLRRLDDAKRWARVTVAISLASGLWIAIVDPANLAGVILIPLIAAGAAFLARTADPRFTRRDLILVPASLTLFAFLPLPLSIAVPLSAAVVVALRIALARPIERLLVRYRRLTVFVVYPLFCLGLAYALSLQRAEGAPRLDIFEDGHWLMPANEMLHGARPYRDIVPGHGLIQDGLLDYVMMRLGATNAGAVLAVRQSLSLLSPVALYFVALALTGSGEAALLTVLGAAAMMLIGTTYYGAISVLDTLATLRPVPALLALACSIAAVRRRDDRLLGAAGALAVLAVLTSVDYGAYAFVVLIVAILRFGPGRKRAISLAMGGAAAVGIVAAMAMAVSGVLLPFLRVTLFEIPKLTEPYALQFFYWPAQHEAIAGLPDALSGLFVPRIVWIVLWALIAIGTAAAIAAIRPPHPLADPMIVAGSWVIVSAVAFGERAHVNFMPVALAMIAAAIYALRRNRTAFAIAAVALAAACAPTRALVRADARLRVHGRLDPILVRYEVLPRAHGVWIDGRNARRLALLQSVVDSTLGPDDTFLDFANMPGLYYLLDRRCPIRLYEVPFYETEALQREVIAALERNPHVRLAVMQFTNRDDVWIDNVPNPIRAPLVFTWLREHFRPLVSRDGVVLWIRR